MKTCHKCGAEKPLDDFPKRSDSKDGYAHECRECRNSYLKAYYAKNKDKIQTQQREFRENNKEHVKAWQKLNRTRHKKEIAERERLHRLNNKDAIRAYGKAWYYANIDRMRELSKKWAKENPEKHSDHQRTRRARKRNAFVEKVELEVVAERDNWICGICGEPVERKDASLDHIKPLAKGGLHSYGNTQLAHLSCNKSKGAKWSEDL